MLRFAVLLACCALGCGEPAEEVCATDGGCLGPGTDAGGEDPGPSIPWLADGEPTVSAPSVTPCPDGWREVIDADGPTTCEPYPEGGHETCAAADEAHFPGEPACRRVGPACPVDGLPAGLPTDRPIVYVRDGAASGDGTRGSPHGSLTAFSFGGLARSTIIAVGSGTYDAVVRLPAEVSLYGACVAQTVLTSSETSATEAVVNARATGSELRAVRIAAPARRGILSIGSLAVGSVIVDDALNVGVAVDDDATLDADELVVRGTRREGGLPSGYGVHADWGSRVGVRRASIVESADVGVVLGGTDTVVRLADVSVLDTNGRGLSIEVGGQLVAQRTAIERNRGTTIFVHGAGTSMELSDSVVRDTLAGGTERTGESGVLVSMGAQARVERVLLDRHRAHAALMFGAGTALELSDALIRDTSPDERDGSFGNGITVEGGASARAARVLLARNRTIAVSATGLDSHVALEDALVRDTESQVSDGLFGRGLSTIHASARVTRAIFEGNRDVGVAASLEPAVLVLEDVVVRDTHPQRMGDLFGRGIGVQLGARVELRRVLAERNHNVGVFASEPTTSVLIEDLVVRGTLLSATGPGIGLTVQAGARAEGRGLTLERNLGFGLLAVSSIGVQLADVVVHDTSAADCPAPCAGLGNGVGAFASTMTLTRFAVTDATLCGVQLARAASLDLADGEVAGCAVGACVQIDDYDLDRLTNGVRYRDNGINLDATELPVPDALAL